MFAILYSDYTIVSINNSLEMISGESHSTFRQQKDKLRDKYPGITISTINNTIISHQTDFTNSGDISHELLTLLNSSVKFTATIEYCFDLTQLILTLKENYTITSFNLTVNSYNAVSEHLLPLLDNLFTNNTNITSFKYSGYVEFNTPNIFNYFGSKTNLRKLTWDNRCLLDLQIPLNLTSLSLSYLSGEQLTQLFTLLQSNNNINSLAINISYIDVNLLLDFFKSNTTIKKLKFRKCCFQNLTPFHLLLDSPNLSSLYLDDNYYIIDNFNLEFALENSTLNHLIYRSHPVDFPYTRFFNGLKYNNFLTKLELINNDKDQPDLDLLIDLIKTNKVLTQLYFTAVESTPELITALESNFTLQDVKGIIGAEHLYTQEALQQRYNRNFLTKNARSVKYN